MKNNETKKIFSIAIKLFTICSIVAVIVAFVNGITKDRIIYNERISTAEALSEIYSEDFGSKSFKVSGEEYIIKDDNGIIAKCVEAQVDEFTDDDITSLFVLTDRDGNDIGYCVAVQPMGFKDVIKMLVAVNPDLSVKGVKIISMSETSGIGTKAADESFLSQFKVKPAAEVNVISGATKTTKPVIGAVEGSVQQVTAYINITGGAANE